MDLRNKLVRFPAKPFQPSLMFAGKARSLLKSGEPERLVKLVQILAL
jgi:hypothetical protein